MIITHLSPTTLGQIDRCPYQHYLYRTLGPKPPGWKLTLGRNVDEARNTTLIRKSESDGELPPEDEIKDLMSDLTERAFDAPLNLTDAPLEGDEKQLKGTLKDESISYALFDRVHFLHNLFPLIVEDNPAVQLKVELEIPNYPVTFLGYMDCVDNEVRPVDLKTTGRQYIPPTEAEDSMQLIFYDFLLRGIGMTPPGSELQFIWKKAKWNEPRDERRIARARTDTDLNWLLQRIDIALEQLEKEIYPPAIHFSNPWWCSEKFCGYWNDCKYARRGK